MEHLSIPFDLMEVFTLKEGEAAACLPGGFVQRLVVYLNLSESNKAKYSKYRLRYTTELDEAA